jgi:hypothetical protein
MKDTGGPAFPTDHNKNVAEGMTLRDYFAAKAMQAYINAYPGGSPDHRDAPIWVPSLAYEMADAMLKERSE